MQQSTSENQNHHVLIVELKKSLMQVAETCHKCKDTATTPKGTIYVRAQVEGKWGSHPICENCWFKENPNREPVRANWENT